MPQHVLAEAPPSSTPHHTSMEHIVSLYLVIITTVNARKSKTLSLIVPPKMINVLTDEQMVLNKYNNKGMICKERNFKTCYYF